MVVVSEVVQPTEDSLVRRCVKGERIAWRALHRRYYSVVRAFLLRLGVTPHELEDACQDVFLEVFRALPAFRGEAALTTWLYRLCVTVATRTRRRSRVAQTLRQVLLLGPREAAVVGPEMSEEKARRQVEQALGRMRPGERAVFVMYELEALPGKQIAEVLRCPVATVWRRLHYARRTFKEALGVAGEQGGDT